MITVSTAILDPDLTLFNRFCDTLNETAKDHLTELIVVDNGSVDKSYQDIATNYFGDKVVFIVNDINKGYGAAHNQAIEIAKGTYFVVCNDDIEFNGPWAESFMGILKDPNVGQVGPLNGVCNHWNSDSLGYGNPKSTNPDYIEGSLFMMRTELAKRYGPFDPIYQYGYYEDGDLSLRLKKDEYELKQVEIQWTHHRAKTTNRIMEETDVYGYQILNKRIFEKRWFSYVIGKKFGKVIVVKREGSFGDVFLTTPVLKRLRELYPNDCIILMSKQYEPILVSNYVDAMTKMHVPIHADTFIDLDYAYEGDFTDIHIVKSYERAVRKQLSPTFTVGGVTGHFRMLREEMPELKRLLPPDFGEYVAVDVGTTWFMKKWPDEYINEFIDRIRKDGYKVVLVGVDPGAMPFSFDMNFVNSLSIEQTVYLLKDVKMYIGQEGLLSHICQSLNKKHIVYYMCTKPEYTADVSLIGKSLFPVISPVVCQGCRHIGPVAGTTVFCTRNYICTRKVTVDMVYDKFKEVVN
jgi:ADP-heptose:LPS heptosyltransferase/GT2 family glycosyltransferase